MAASRWQEIYDSLRERIESGELPPGTALSNDQTLADQWEVSRLTAHRALYELQRSGYVARKRKAGTVVLTPRPAQRNTISAIFFNVNNRFEASLLNSLSENLGDEVQLAVVNSRHDAERELELVLRQSRESAAIILYPTCMPENDAALNELCESGYPLVCLDRYPAEVRCDAVLTDNYGATRAGMDLLIAGGHRRIAHFTDLEPFVTSTRDRLQGYQDAMHEARLSTEGLVRTFPYLTPDSAREYEQTVQLIEDALFSMVHRPDPPTAVFGMRDLYATATLDACDRLGLRVPEDLQILAFLDRPSVMMRRPERILRINQDIDELGRIAGDRIARRLKGEELLPARILVPALIDQPVAGARVSTGALTFAEPAPRT